MPLDSLVLSADKIKEMRESLELFLDESVVRCSGRFLSATLLLLKEGGS